MLVVWCLSTPSEVTAKGSTTRTATVTATITARGTATTSIQEAQPRDTVAYTSKNPLVISATRSAKRLEDVSVPTTVLDAAMITQTGQRRLDGM
jgi:hypothetical protein